MAGPHHRKPSVLVREHAGDQPMFRAVCSCGWVSHPVEAEQAVYVWVRHADDRSPGSADSAGGPGSAG